MRFTTSLDTLEQYALPLRVVAKPPGKIGKSSYQANYRGVFFLLPCLSQRSQQKLTFAFQLRNIAPIMLHIRQGIRLCIMLSDMNNLRLKLF